MCSITRKNCGGAGTSSGRRPDFFPATAAGWAAFREAMKRIGSEAPDTPVIGTADYHWVMPGPTRIRSAVIDDAGLSVELEDGRRVTVPLRWFPILMDAMSEERSEIVVEPDALRFPKLNTEITLAQILVCHGLLDEPEFLALCASPERVEENVATLRRRAAAFRPAGPDAG